MTGVEALSPELALVDPELAARLRALLPDPGCFRPASRPRLALEQRSLPPLVAPAPNALAPAPMDPARRQIRRRALVAAVAAVGAGSVAIASIAGPAVLAGGGTGVSPVDALRQRATADIRAARTYRWPEVQGAVGYRAELRRDGAVVFSAFARKPQARLPVDLRFEPGRYTWTVRPASPGAVGRPVVEETFVVPTGA